MKRSYYINESGVIGCAVSTEKKHELKPRSTDNNMFSVDASKVKRALYRLVTQSELTDCVSMITLTFPQSKDVKYNEIVSAFLESAKNKHIKSYVWVRESRDLSHKRHNNDVHFHVIVTYAMNKEDITKSLDVKALQKMYNDHLYRAQFKIKTNNSLRVGTFDKKTNKRIFFLDKRFISSIASYLSKYLSCTDRFEYRVWGCTQDVTPQCRNLNEKQYNMYVAVFDAAICEISQDYHVYKVDKIKWSQIMQFFYKKSVYDFELIYDYIDAIVLDRVDYDNDFDCVTVEDFEKMNDRYYETCNDVVIEREVRIFENEKEYNDYHAI